MRLADNQLQEMLLQSHLLDKALLDDVRAYSQDNRISLQEAAIEKGLLSDEDLSMMIAKSIKAPFVSLSKQPINDSAMNAIPSRIARKHKIIGFAESDKEIKVAVADPNKKEVLDLLSRKTAKTVSMYLASERDIENALQLYRKELQDAFNELTSQQMHGSITGTSEAPIEKIVDLLVTYAYHDKASDIHIEPEEDRITIRFRIDSMLHEVLHVNKQLHNRIVARIKVLAHLQTDEHMNPQDGRIRMHIEDELVDIRVSVLPISDGEKVVLRLLSSKNRQFSLAELGMNEKDLKKVSNAMSKSYGLILSTGPTGSGKTTSIYSLLKTLNSRDKNITTIEDPIEYKMKGVNQIQVNPKTKLSFANGLRSILRQDPNVIFVGEIRDNETARIAVNAALTGHSVLSTLHTNDAATTLPRLIDMEVEPFLVASTINIIIAQRLIRKICVGCKTEVQKERKELLQHFSENTLSKFFGKKKQITLYKGKGCKACHFTGFSGRVGIFEVMEMTESIQQLIIQKKDARAIQKQAILEGMTPMAEDGLHKIIDGTTTYDEVLRVMKTNLL